MGKLYPPKYKKLDENELPIRLWQRNPPVRQRVNIPTTWLKITIVEGKNRQIRRMVAHVGLPCLRLIRSQIGIWQLNGLAVGESRVLQLDQQTLLKLGLSAQPTPKQNKPTNLISSNTKGAVNPKSGKIHLLKKTILACPPT